MKSTTIFFIFILLSPAGLFTAFSNSFDSQTYQININDGVTIGDKNSALKDLKGIVILNENLIMANLEKYYNHFSITKIIHERLTVFERSAPISRNRVMYEEEISNEKQKVSVSEYLEIISDYFFDGEKSEKT
jgi:hypothetical protein